MQTTPYDRTSFLTPKMSGIIPMRSPTTRAGFSLSGALFGKYVGPFTDLIPLLNCLTAFARIVYASTEPHSDSCSTHIQKLYLSQLNQKKLIEEHCLY